jgi:LmbE family N-acetylglucosaminyl deacetylase
MKKFVLLLALCTGYKTWSQQSPTSGDIYLGLKKLNVLGSVLYIAAHPDDENTRLLTYLSKDKMYRTGYLSLTRGDGGQNLIGDEQGIPLGLIRTQELLSARRIDGAEQFFTRAYDFGYSKTPEETFTKWDREKILSDVVWVIRKFQPDVIITRFPTTGEGGHGHHTASAVLANEAFVAAADPSRFPDQLRTVKPWQAKRVVWNSFNPNSNTPPADAFRVDVGGYNAVLGKSYGEIAAESRSQHKSQGFGVQRTRGEAFEYFRTTGGVAPQNDLLEGVVTGWDRVPGSAEVQRLIKNTIDSFVFDQPQRSLPALIRMYTALRKLPDSYWKIQKAAEVKTLIEQASGLWLEAFTNQAYVAQDDSIRISFSINDRMGAGIQLRDIKVESFDTILGVSLTPNKNFNFTKNVKVFRNMPVTQPYWLEKKMEEGYFVIPDQMLVGKPDVDPAFTVQFGIRIANEDMYVTRPVYHKFTDPVKGEQNQPVTVVPPVTVYASPELLLLKKGDRTEKSFQVQTIVNKPVQFNETVVSTHIGEGKLTVKDTGRSFAKGSKLQYPFTLSSGKFPSVSERAYPSVKIDKGVAMNLSLATVKYDHIPNINYFYSDWVKLVPIDLKTEGKRIGYIVGAGDKVPDALEEMGYEVTLLSDKELSRNNLHQFDAIITGVRAYNTNEWLNNHYEKLMDYVRNGGNLIVQYNTSSNLGPVRAKIGPFHFDIGRNRITDENAPVSFLLPEHPVLNYPNKITQDDFKGWVQERSIYHATRQDTSFRSILRMNDPGEQGDDGSLIVAPYGKGFFTYTGLVFFRELPAGVPGAYRLMANLIALNRKRTF